MGRIAIRGATLFSGYWPDGGGGPGPDGWYVTGDIGYLDDAGELHLVDRAAEVIKVAGFTVYPREVEEVLATHPYVAEVAVIGLRDPRGQEQVVAVLVARAGKHPTPGDLTDFVSELLPPFKRPVAFHLVDGLPRTEVGRLDRAAVQRQFVSGIRPAAVERGGGEPADAESGSATGQSTWPSTSRPTPSPMSPRSRWANWQNSVSGCPAPASTGPPAAIRTPTRTCSDRHPTAGSILDG